MNASTDPVTTLDDQQRAFREALRNPFERACKVVSDVLQGAFGAAERTFARLSWRSVD